MTQQAAKRRRTQARNGYKHIAKLGRPLYHKFDASTSAERLAATIAREHRRAQNKGKKGEK